MSLASLPIAVVDVESTGLGEDSRAVEIAVVHLDLASGTLPTVAFSERLNPDIPMEPGASKVTGITDADLKDCPSFFDIHVRLLGALEGRTLCAYNVPADWTWLQRELDIMGHVDEGAASCDFCGEHDLNGSGHEPFAPCPSLPTIPHAAEWIDGLVLAKACDKYEKNKRLAAVCARRGVAVDAHGAAGDAVATALIIERLLRDVAGSASPTKKWPTALDYILWQQRTALAQEVDFCGYILKAHGGNRARPDVPWHELLKVEPPAWPEQKPPVGRCLKCREPAVYKINQAGEVQAMTPTHHPHKCRK